MNIINAKTLKPSEVAKIISKGNGDTICVLSGKRNDLVELELQRLHPKATFEFRRVMLNGRRIVFLPTTSSIIDSWGVRGLVRYSLILHDSIPLIEGLKPIGAQRE